MVDMMVEYDYDAVHEDELTLRPGDIIRNARRMDEEGWMEGELNGRRGLFPDNFVKELKKESRDEQKEEPLNRRASGNVASLVQRMSTYGIPAGGFQPHSLPRNFQKKTKKRQCKVLFDYIPQNEDELGLKVGDIIEITEEIEEGWWSGTMNDKSGLFPSNFVKEINVGEDEEAKNGAEETESGAKDSLLTPTPVPTTPTSLAAGNGVGAQQKKVRGIGFGDIFRDCSVKLKPPVPLMEPEEKKTDKPLPSLPSAAKPVHLNMTDSSKADGDSKAKVKEYCKVTFPYEATNGDELSLKEGEVIHVLSKDTGEPGWWKGEINGKSGVFPDNFVSLLSEAEKEAGPLRGSVKAANKAEPEEKPRKPPPPSKVLAPKPEAPSAEKKPPPPRPEDRDRPMADGKPSKPAAPLVPPKKPAPPPGKATSINRLSTGQPKRLDKPPPVPTAAKPNGEVPSTRPKSDIEPSILSKPKTLSGDWGEKTAELDLMSFDELSSTSEKLSHPTTSRPKMPGRRLPAQFGGASASNKDGESEKVPKVLEEEEEDALKPKLEVKKSCLSAPASSPATKPCPLSTPEPKPKAGSEEGKASEMQELRVQMKELLLTVELLKSHHSQELAELRAELDKERLKRIALQVDVEKLKSRLPST